MTDRAVLRSDDVSITVTDFGGDGPVVVLLNGLAGSSREMLPTAHALPGHRVLLVDQRGRGFPMICRARPSSATSSQCWRSSCLGGAPRSSGSRWEPTPREFLGQDAIVDAWVADLERTDDGLVPRFDAEVMQRAIEAVHEPRRSEWEGLQVPTLAVFAKHGMFGNVDKDALIRRRPQTDRVGLDGGSHDAHLDAFDE